MESWYVMRILFLILLGLGYGILASAGVFTVFMAVGLVPRFAGKTHTAGKILLYEEMVVFGTLIGALWSVYPEFSQVAAWAQQRFPDNMMLIKYLGIVAQGVFGLFAGMFVGCLALAIAEMLDSFPILARRISFRHGLGLAILSLALGKVFGSLWYFLYELHTTVE